MDVYSNFLTSIKNNLPIQLVIILDFKIIEIAEVISFFPGQFSGMSKSLESYVS